jgi:hypothetical protein
LVNDLPYRHDGFCREDGAEQQLRQVGVHTEAHEPVAGLAAARLPAIEERVCAQGLPAIEERVCAQGLDVQEFPPSVSCS